MMAEVGESISRMPGPPLRSLVADDDDVALLDLVGEDGLQRRFLGIEDAGAAGELFAFLAGDFADAAHGREVAVEDDEMARRLDRVVEAVDDVLVLRVGLHVLEIFRDGPAGDGHAVAVEQALIEQHFHQRRETADADERGHDVLAAGLEVGEDGHALADAGEVVERELHAGAVRDGEEMEHGVGRAARAR